jgi:methylase of polypeptide subunit release factors
VPGIRELARQVGHGARHWLINRAYGRYQRHRLSRSHATQLHGRRFLTDPEVLHPVYFRSTPAMIDKIRALDLAGKRFLDMGSGSGALGVFAAARGAHVTACDINPRAVALTRTNFDLNAVAGEVLESDLFQSLGSRLFDVICFNIPFYEGAAHTPFEAALYGGPGLATVAAFARGCCGSLAPGGRVMIIFSEQADRGMIMRLFAAAGLVTVDETVERRMFERFHLVTFQANDGAPDGAVAGGGGESRGR